MGFWTFHRAPSFLTFLADFTTQVGIFHQLAGFYLYTPIWEKAPRKHFEKQHVRWLDICHVQSESVRFQKTAADRETTWILCPCCHQLVILSSVATSLPLYCHCAVRVDVSIPDIKPCPSRRLKQPETAVRGRCFKFCCSAIVSRLKRFSSRRPPFLSHLSAPLLDLFVRRLARLHLHSLISFLSAATSSYSPSVLFLLQFWSCTLYIVFRINGWVLTSVHPDDLQTFLLFNFWNFWSHTFEFGSKLLSTLKPISIIRPKGLLAAHNWATIANLQWKTV